jgi:Helicase associated domain
LQKFAAREGHCAVPKKHIEGGFKLGQWVNSQRFKWAQIPLERQQKLSSLGFERGPHNSAWNAHLAALEKFKLREGHCAVPFRHVEGDLHLGRWVSRQRKALATIVAERKARLDKIGFEWDLIQLTGAATT